MYWLPLNQSSKVKSDVTSPYVVVGSLENPKASRYKYYEMRQGQGLDQAYRSLGDLLLLSMQESC
jgi:hypothetical protein